MIDGFIAPGFEPVKQAFSQNFADSDELGAGFALLIDGEKKVELWGGFADRSKTRPWTQDTLAPVYSVTKPIASLVIGMLHDRGLLDLGAPIASVWEAFAAHGKGEISIAKALGHQAGTPGFLTSIDPALWYDQEGIEEALAALAPMWPPGTAHGYHPYTFGVIAGALARRADGRTLGTILRQEVCEPMGVAFTIGTPAALHPRCAEIVKPKAAPSFTQNRDLVKAAFGAPWATPARGSALWREAEFPAANGHGTALSTAQLYQAFACEGMMLGRRIFSAETHAALTAPLAPGGPDLVLPFNLTFCAGILLNTNAFYGPNPKAMGHSGWGGCIGFADPAHRLSGAYVINRQSAHLMGDPRALRLIAAVYSCL